MNHHFWPSTDNNCQRDPCPTLVHQPLLFPANVLLKAADVIRLFSVYEKSPCLASAFPSNPMSQSILHWSRVGQESTGVHQSTAWLYERGLKSSAPSGKTNFLQPRIFATGKPIESFSVSSGSIFGPHCEGLSMKHVITRIRHQTRSNERGPFISFSRCRVRYFHFCFDSALRR